MINKIKLFVLFVLACCTVHVAAAKKKVQFKAGIKGGSPKGFSGESVIKKAKDEIAEFKAKKKKDVQKQLTAMFPEFVQAVETFDVDAVVQMVEDGQELPSVDLFEIMLDFAVQDNGFLDELEDIVEVKGGDFKRLKKVIDRVEAISCIRSLCVAKKLRGDQKTIRLQDAKAAYRWAQFMAQHTDKTLKDKLKQQEVLEEIKIYNPSKQQMDDIILQVELLRHRDNWRVWAQERCAKCYAVIQRATLFV